MPLFYDRLQEALQILSDYFMCDGRGLDGERLFCQTYRDMDLLLGLARLSSQQLIVEYYRSSVIFMSPELSLATGEWPMSESWIIC